MPTGVYKHKPHSDNTKEKMSQTSKKVGKGKWMKNRKWSKELIKKRWETRYSRVYPRKFKTSEKKHLDTKYKYWMLEVKKRDNWKCRLLSSDCNGRLESHHIFNWIDYPELRYVITNGITLCAFHHPRKWEEEKRMIPIFQELLSVSKDYFGK